MRRQFSKRDAVFLGALLLVCVLFWLGFRLFSGKTGTTVTVTRDGEVYGSYALSEEQTVEITDADGNVTNVLTIQDGKAAMTSADCSDKLCVKQRAISAENETIVCLPNRIVVTVSGADEKGLDSFAR